MQMIPGEWIERCQSRASEGMGHQCLMSEEHRLGGACRSRGMENQCNFVSLDFGISMSMQHQERSLCMLDRLVRHWTTADEFLLQDFSHCRADAASVAVNDAFAVDFVEQ